MLIPILYSLGVFNLQIFCDDTSSNDFVMRKYSVNHVIANGVKQSLINKNRVSYILEMYQNLVEISTLANINLTTVVVLWIIAHNIS